LGIIATPVDLIQTVRSEARTSVPGMRQRLAVRASPVFTGAVALSVLAGHLRSASASGQVVVAVGTEGVLVRTEDDGWHRQAVGHLTATLIGIVPTWIDRLGLLPSSLPRLFSPGKHPRLVMA
jgi:hypothetical protein